MAGKSRRTTVATNSEFSPHARDIIRWALHRYRRQTGLSDIDFQDKISSTLASNGIESDRFDDDRYIRHFLSGTREPKKDDLYKYYYDFLKIEVPEYVKDLSPDSFKTTLCDFLLKFSLGKEFNKNALSDKKNKNLKLLTTKVFYSRECSYQRRDSEYAETHRSNSTQHNIFLVRKFASSSYLDFFCAGYKSHSHYYEGFENDQNEEFYLNFANNDHIPYDNVYKGILIPSKEEDIYWGIISSQDGDLPPVN